MSIPFLISLSVILMLIYTATQPGTTSPIGITLWAALIVTVITLLYKRTYKFTRSQYLFLLVMGSVLILHSSNTSDSWLSAFMYFAIFFLLFFLIQDRPRKYKNFFLILIIAVCCQALLFGSNLAHALITRNEYYAFKGYFLNSNTCSIFCACAYIASFIYIKNRTAKTILMAICIAGIIGGMSRNAIIFLLLFHLYLYLIKKYNCNKILLYTLPVIVIFAAHFLIFNDTSSSLSFFGKTGTTGRAEQLIYIYNNYTLNLWGNGRDLLSNDVASLFLVPPHNMYFFTAYGMGLPFLILYIIFVFYLYSKLKSPKSKSILLAIHFYYFFEPIVPFESSLSFYLPYILLILIDKYDAPKIMTSKE